MPSSRWDPAQHPRGPLGRFAVVGTSARARAEVGTAFVGRRNRDYDTVPPSYLEGEDLSVISNGSGWGNLPPARRSEIARVNQAYRIRQAELEAEQALARAPIDRTTGPRPDDWEDPLVAGRNESRAEIEQAIDGISDHDNSRFMGGQMEAMGTGSFAESVHVVEIRDNSIESWSDRRLPFKAVRKKVGTRDEVDAEVLSSEVAASINAPVVVARPDSDDGQVVWMERAEGGIGAGAEIPNQRDYTAGEIRNYREGSARLAAFDQLVGNRDRHDGNWIMADDGTPIGIDNGLAWGGGHETMRSAEDIRWVQKKWKDKEQKSGDWNPDRLSDEELQSWGPKLEALRPTFEAHGKTAWHDQMMTNYGQIMNERILSAVPLDPQVDAWRARMKVATNIGEVAAIYREADAAGLAGPLLPFINARARQV